MIPVYSPVSESESINLSALLRGDGIYYYLHNEHFGSLKPGPYIPLYNSKTFLVAVSDYERASELIRDYLDICQPPRTRFSAFHLIRMILEVVVGWVVPYQPRATDENDKTV